jgi:hypothetical protein
MSARVIGGFSPCCCRCVWQSISIDGSLAQAGRPENLGAGT